MKRFVLVLAGMALAAASVLGALIWRDARRHRESRAASLEATREEARQLVHYCEMTGFDTKIGMGTANMLMYFNTDPAKARHVLETVVRPVIDAQELACASAKSDIETVQRDANSPDCFIDNALPQVEANLATLAHVRDALDALSRALTGPVDVAGWTKQLGALRAAAN